MMIYVKDSINSDFFYFKSKTENVTTICKLDFCRPFNLKMLFTLYMYILHSKPKHCRNKKENISFTGKKER